MNVHARQPSQSAASSATRVERSLEDLLEPVIATVGFELVKVQWQPGGRRVVRVFIDGPDGITVEDCARVSRIVSNELDVAEQDPDAGALAGLLGSAYTLEVSSPGLDRPLSRLSHFHKFAGRRATVRTLAPIVVGNTRKSFQGQIEGVERDPEHPGDDRSGVVVLRAEDDTVYRIPLAEIRRASLVYEG